MSRLTRLIPWLRHRPRPGAIEPLDPREEKLLGQLRASRGHPKTTTTKKGKTMKALITTRHRGVFAGEIAETQDLSATAMPVKNARMAIRFGTTKGVMQLAETGPTGDSRISAPADIPMLHDITAVFAITDDAWAKWQAA